MKRATFLVTMVGVLIYLLIPIGDDGTDVGDDVTVLQFWHPWSGEYADALQEVVAEFNQQHDHLKINALFMPTGAGENMKFFVSVAGGVPPDIIVVDGTAVASWADKGVLRPIDDFLAEADIKADDFWAPCWKQCRYNGKTWALSAAADANFSLIWNKFLFREADLPEDEPPRTFEDLMKYTKKLTKYDENGRIATFEQLQKERGFEHYDGDGRIVQIGFLPTFMSSAENAMLTWGWVFGGEFYDEQKDEFTCDDPRIVKSLEWMLEMRDFYGGQRLLRAFSSGFGDAAQHPFYMGKLAMHVSYIADTQNIEKFAPNLEWGIAPLPGPVDGEIGSAWIGGWTLAIPYGQRGNEKEAFEFIRWFTADPKGTTFVSRRMKLLPAYRLSPFFKKDVPEDPILTAYYDILQRAKHTRPITPVNSYYIQQLRRALSRSMEGLETPAEALRKARLDTEKHYKKMQERTQAKHSR